MTSIAFDPKMAEVVQRYGCVILMHNGRELGETPTRGTSQTQDTVQWVMEGLKESIEIAKQAGIKMMTSSGCGHRFGKSVEENLELVNRLSEFKSMGYPF